MAGLMPSERLKMRKKKNAEVDAKFPRLWALPSCECLMGEKLYRVTLLEDIDSEVMPALASRWTVEESDVFPMLWIPACEFPVQKRLNLSIAHDDIAWGEIGMRENDAVSDLCL